MEFGSFCSISGRPNTVCAKVQPLVAASTGGFLGKRAGALCKAMEECDATQLTSCALATEGKIPEGTLDLCKAEGTSAGVTQPEASTRPAGSCTSNDCSAVGAATAYMCNNIIVGQTCSCNATGHDTCTPYATCVRTPCKVCGDCLVEMRALSTQYSSDLQSNATHLSSAFSTACLTSKRPTGLCQNVQLAIAASISGRLALRPAALCRLLGECPASWANVSGCTAPAGNGSMVPFTNLDYCTVDGVIGGDVPSGVVASTALLDPGRCLSAANCTGDATQCSTASDGKQWCTCSNGTDTCRALGMCIQTSCDACKACVKRVGNFVSQQLTLNASVVADNFVGNCTSNWGKNTNLCDSLKNATSVSYNGNMGKRAGLLCSALQECAKDLGTSCNITAAVGSANVTRPLGLCSIEGVNGGTPVNNIGSSITIPTGRCFLSEDCRSTDLMCSMSGTTVKACACADGSDTCRDLGSCIPTPCKACSNCLVEWRMFAWANLDTMAAATIASVFKTACDASGRNTTLCGEVQAAVAASRDGAMAKRAGHICRRLNECDITNLGTSCVVSARTLDGRVLSTPLSNLSSCTLEGLPGETQKQ